MQDDACNLQTCFLCQTCNPAWKEVIAVKKKTIFYKKGQSIFNEGDEVKGIFFIFSGAAKVYQHWGDQKELIIRFATAGDVLGHRGIGTSHVYPITATAMENTKTCFITNDFLEATLQANPNFTYRMMHFYATELQKAERRMRNLVHMEVKGRIADALLELSRVFGVNSEGFITMPVTRQDIASYAGTTYETVFKFFVALTAANIITTAGKNIKIMDAEKLAQFIKPVAS